MGGMSTESGAVVSNVITAVLIEADESWTVKKAESQRIDAFEQWCWRRLLRVPGQLGDQISQY